MTLIFSVLFFLYFILVIALMMGWNKSRMTKVSHEGESFNGLLSVIIPVRDEAKTIVALLAELSHQSYQNFEVIVVNDHSNDRTAKLVTDFTMKDNRIKLLDSTGEGKKTALTQGIQASRGEVIVTTDGDCRVNANWLSSVAHCFDQRNIQFAFGGVKIEGDSLFSKIQAHEFLSLVGTAAATLGLGFPITCNGANLAFRRSAFFEVGGYDDNLHIPSGDDEFLMRKMFSFFPNGVQFNADEQAVVKTLAVDIKQFIQQRIRWAGKWKLHVSVVGALLAIFIFVFQSALILLPFAMMVGWIDPVTGCILLLIKALVELIFLKQVSTFVGLSWKWTLFILLQFVYPFYVVFIGLVANVSSFKWKGRKFKSFAVNTINK